MPNGDRRRFSRQFWSCQSRMPLMPMISHVRLVLTVNM